MKHLTKAGRENVLDMYGSVVVLQDNRTRTHGLTGQAVIRQQAYRQGMERVLREMGITNDEMAAAVSQWRGLLNDVIVRQQGVSRENRL